MDIEKALKQHVREFGKLGELVAEPGPMLKDVKIAAACFYEAAKLLQDEYSAKIVAVPEDGGLLLIEWSGSEREYTAKRVSPSNIANVILTGRDYRKGYLADSKLIVEVFSPVDEEQRLEFQVLSREERGTLAASLYDDDVKPAKALEKVAEALWRS